MNIGIFDISFVEICLVAGLVAAFIYEIYFYIRYIRLRRGGKPGEDKQSPRNAQPPVSVIVCARNEGYNLQAYIQSLLTQDYPEYEVIIVNDGSEDKTQAVIDDYVISDPRVRTTFVPKGARVKSTKKLGLTLAIKAAKYDFILLTDADCRPESRSWISAVMDGFHANQREIAIVLGFGAYFNEPTLLNGVIQYETLFNGLHYLGAAVAGKPYMGVGRNLAYRKSAFFEHGGFSDQMTEFAGDDDLLVNRIATKTNTAVVTSPESITWSVPKRTWKSWWQQKRRHLSVSHAYRPATKRHLLREPLARALFYGIIIALFVLGEPLSLCVAFGLLIVRLLVQCIILNSAAKRLGLPAIGLELLWYDICLPVVTLVAMCGKKRSKW